MVELLCDAVHDSIKCICADQGHASQWMRPDRRCERSRPGCCLPEFFENRRDVFHRIREAISGLPPGRLTAELTRFAEIIDSALEDSHILKDHTVCREFGDAIIAAESAPYTSFFTQNVQESDVLCRALGQLLLYLHQDPQAEVELRDFREAPSLGASDDEDRCHNPARE